MYYRDANDFPIIAHINSVECYRENNSYSIIELLSHSVS